METLVKDLLDNVIDRLDKIQKRQEKQDEKFFKLDQRLNEINGTLKEERVFMRDSLRQAQNEILSKLELIDQKADRTSREFSMVAKRLDSDFSEMRETALNKIEEEKMLLRDTLQNAKRETLDCLGQLQNLVQSLSPENVTPKQLETSAEEQILAKVEADVKQILDTLQSLTRLGSGDLDEIMKKIQDTVEATIIEKCAVEFASLDLDVKSLISDFSSNVEGQFGRIRKDIEGLGVQKAERDQSVAELVQAENAHAQVLNTLQQNVSYVSDQIRDVKTSILAEATVVVLGSENRVKDRLNETEKVLASLYEKTTQDQITGMLKTETDVCEKVQKSVNELVARIDKMEEKIAPMELCGTQILHNQQKREAQGTPNIHGSYERKTGKVCLEINERGYILHFSVDNVKERTCSDTWFQSPPCYIDWLGINMKAELYFDAYRCVFLSLNYDGDFERLKNSIYQWRAFLIDPHGILPKRVITKQNVNHAKRKSFDEVYLELDTLPEDYVENDSLHFLYKIVFLQ